MIYSELIIEIDRFVELIKELFPNLEVLHSGSKEYLVKERWGESTQFFNENGIYFYLTKDEDVLYIGKADQVSEKGIGNRAYGDIEKIDEGRFNIAKGKPNRQLDQKLSSEIKEGNVYISGSVVKPSYLSCLLEIFALSECKSKDKVLPIFNSKIC